MGRGFLIWLVGPLLIAAVAAAAPPGVDSKTAPPNIVVIVSDDLSYGALGYTGSTATTTPHIDSLIEGGTYFTNGYVANPMCAPSRAGLMTGRYPVRFGYENMSGPIETQIRDDIGVDLHEILLPTYLKRAGYATAVIGKWHLGYNAKYRPDRRGVDHFFGFLAGGHSYFEWDAPEVGYAGGAILRNNEKAEGEGYITAALAQAAASFVHLHRSQPFLLYFAPYNVHAPHEVPEEYLPEDGNVMAGMVKALDASVGVILTALEQANLVQNTLVVFINDNGNREYNSPFRSGKGFLYEGGIRVPFAMRWPRVIPAGNRYENPVIQLDILPTILAAVGWPLPTDRPIDGVNLLPYVKGEIEDAPHPQLFWQSPGDYGMAARVGDLKVILPTGGRPQLYDLSVDPGEHTDLAPGRKADMSRIMEAYGKWVRSTVPQKRKRSKKKGKASSASAAGDSE